MNTIYFNDYEYLCEHIYNLSEKLYEEGESLSIVASDYFEAKEIFKELNDYNLDYYILDLVDYNDYTDEYVITIYDRKISIEKAKYIDEYLYGDDKVVFISAIANSKVIKYYRDSEIYIYDFENDDEEEDICLNCNRCENYSYDDFEDEFYDEELLYDLDLLRMLRLLRR